MTTRTFKAHRCLAPFLSGLVMVWVACSPSSSYVKQGTDLVSQGRYEEAISLYQSVIASGKVPSERLADRIAEAEQGMAGERAERGSRALEAGDLDLAAALAIEARELAPGQPQVRALIEAYTSLQLDVAADQLAKKQTAQAIRALDAALVVAPDHARARETRDELAQAYTKHLEAAIRRHDELGLPGNALVASLVMEWLHPDLEELREEVDRRRAELREASRIPVTWELKGNRSLSRDVRAALANLSFDAPFLTLQAGPQTSKSLHISLSEPEGSFSTRTEGATRSKSVRAGTRQVENPKLKETHQRLRRTVQELESLGETIDALHARVKELTDAREQNTLRERISELERRYHHLSLRYVELQGEIQALPAEVTVPAYREIQIPIRVHHKTFRVALDFHGTSKRADLPLNVRFQVSGEAETEGEAHEDFPEYGLEATGPQFELSEAELRRLAIRDLVGSVGETTDALIRDVLVLELQRARGWAQAGKMAEAVEVFVEYLLGTGFPPPEDMEALFAERGLLDVGRIRREGGTGAASSTGPEATPEASR